MSHRGILFGWVAVLLILALLAAWTTLSPALSNKNMATADCQKALAGPGQAAGGKVPVQVGISIEKISGFSQEERSAGRRFLHLVQVAATGRRAGLQPRSIV